ncbi:MAG: hypothetical protein AAFP93_00295, partial [Bacteroidota bacterium]
MQQKSFMLLAAVFFALFSCGREEIIKTRDVKSSHRKQQRRRRENEALLKQYTALVPENFVLGTYAGLTKQYLTRDGNKGKLQIAKEVKDAWCKQDAKATFQQYVDAIPHGLASEKVKEAIAVMDELAGVSASTHIIEEYRRESSYKAIRDYKFSKVDLASHSQDEKTTMNVLMALRVEGAMVRSFLDALQDHVGKNAVPYRYVKSVIEWLKQNVSPEKRRAKLVVGLLERNEIGLDNKTVIGIIKFLVGYQWLVGKAKTLRVDATVEDYVTLFKNVRYPESVVESSVCRVAARIKQLQRLEVLREDKPSAVIVDARPCDGLFTGPVPKTIVKKGATRAEVLNAMQAKLLAGENDILDIKRV